MRLKEVERNNFSFVNDIITMPSKLNEIAELYTNEGYEVSRGLAGTVILKLEGGEVHFVPAGDIVQQIVFKYLN